MLCSTIERRTSTRQIACQTRRQHDASSSLSILILPHMMNRKLHRVVRRCEVHIVHPSVRLLQLALLVQLIFKELILVLCYARVDKDDVDRAKPFDSGLESFALAIPVREIALQGKNTVGFDE
jgi:hypothetical protein